MEKRRTYILRISCQPESWSKFRYFCFFIAKERLGVILRYFPETLTLEEVTLRDDYLKEAQKKITDPMILVNVVSRRAKQLKSGYKPLIESLERLSAEDMALREIMEGKITYQLAESDEE